MPGFPFSWPIQVRFRDIDGMGHVNNAVFFTYIEAARTEYLYGLLKTERMDQVDWIVASASMNYRKAIGYGDPLEVRVIPKKIGTTSFTLYYEIWDTKKDVLCGDGETVIVMFDYAKGEKKPLTDDLRKKLEADQAS